MNNYCVRRVLQAISLLIFLLLSGLNPLFAENVKIVFSPDDVTGKINPLICGNSMLGYNLTHLGRKGDVNYSNYGAGIWNPDTNQSVPEVIRLAKDTGMTIARFPGGSGSLFYNWKETIGPPESRPKFLYGLDEFLKTCEQIGCEAVYTLPYLTGTYEDAADLVEYLNSPDNNSNPGGGVDWAGIRKKNGHPQPYRVKYFELGNEVYGGAPAVQIPGVDPQTYAKDYLEYKHKMKEIDSSIMLGAVTVNSKFSKGYSPWNEELFKGAGDSIDFLIDHTYIGSYTSNDEDVDPNVIFAHAFEDLDEVEIYYRRLANHFEKITGRKNIPIAVTEYNVGFNQEKPVPFRHSLGAALINAGLLQIFLKPENHILMANYWQFVNSAYGMIKNDKYMQGTGNYIKRPNYYAFKMFHEYFGDELIDVNISGNDHAVASEKENVLSNIDWKTKFVLGADIKVQGEHLEVTFKGRGDLNFHQLYKRAAIKPSTTYELSGFIKAEDLKDLEGVCLAIEDGRGWKETHSAEATERVWGTTDWVKVKLDYTTLSDATEVAIMVRRVSGKGPVKGKVYIKDVTLVERKESGLKDARALSVSASRVQNGKSVYLMVLNKNVYEGVEAEIQPGNSDLLNTINIWTLNGPSIIAVNEINPNNVTIKHESINVNDMSRFTYTFPPHSLTSLEFKVR